MDGADYVLSGSKTFTTNGPYADTIVFICKLDEGNAPKERKVLELRARQGHAGLTQSKPLRKMGCIGSATGELFLDDVRVGRERLLGETEDAPARSSAKGHVADRARPPCRGGSRHCGTVRELCVDYAKTRARFGRPIGDFQLIQLKLAKMEIARMNIQSLVFRQIELEGAASR